MDFRSMLCEELIIGELRNEKSTEEDISLSYALNTHYKADVNLERIDEAIINRFGIDALKRIKHNTLTGKHKSAILSNS